MGSTKKKTKSFDKKKQGEECFVKHTSIVFRCGRIYNRSVPSNPRSNLRLKHLWTVRPIKPSSYSPNPLSQFLPYYLFIPNHRIDKLALTQHTWRSGGCPCGSENHCPGWSWGRRTDLQPQTPSQPPCTSKGLFQLCGTQLNLEIANKRELVEHLSLLVAVFNFIFCFRTIGGSYFTPHLCVFQ